MLVSLCSVSPAGKGHREYQGHPSPDSQPSPLRPCTPRLPGRHYPDTFICPRWGFPLAEKGPRLCQGAGGLWHCPLATEVHVHIRESTNSPQPRMALGAGGSRGFVSQPLHPLPPAGGRPPGYDSKGCPAHGCHCSPGTSLNHRELSRHNHITGEDFRMSGSQSFGEISLSSCLQRRHLQ